MKNKLEKEAIRVSQKEVSDADLEKSFIEDEYKIKLNCFFNFKPQRIISEKFSPRIRISDIESFPSTNDSTKPYWQSQETGEKPSESVKKTLESSTQLSSSMNSVFYRANKKNDLSIVDAKKEKDNKNDTYCGFSPGFLIGHKF